MYHFGKVPCPAIRQIVEAADRESVVGRELAVRAEPRRSGDVTVLMGEVDEERHPYTGALMLRRRDVRIPTTMADYGTFGPSETAVAPQAYYVLPEAAAPVENDYIVFAMATRNLNDDNLVEKYRTAGVTGSNLVHGKGCENCFQTGLVGRMGVHELLLPDPSIRALINERAPAEKIQEYRDLFSNPYIAAERGYVDAIIAPRETRPTLIRAFDMLSSKKELRPYKKHGNIPV